MTPLKGKASAKHYLNTKLKPIDSFLSKEKRYPVYLRIGFNKKQTDIKSQFVLFGDTELFRDPLEVFDLDDECSLTKKEFEKVEPWVAKAFADESKVISEAIQFIGSLGFNALEHNPAQILTTCIWTIDSIVSRHFNSIMRLKMTKEHPDLALIIHWDVMYFDHLYKNLLSYGNRDLNAWLSQFKPLMDASELVARAIGDNARVYQWNRGMVQGETELDAQAIKYVRLAIRQHYSTHFQQTHPELLQSLKKIV